MSLFLSLIALASQSPDAAAANATTSAKPADADKAICKRLEMTGTRVGGRRVCATKEQWQAQERAAQQTGRELTRPPVPASSN